MVGRGGPLCRDVVTESPIWCPHREMATSCSGQRDLDLWSPRHRRTPDDSEVLVFQHLIEDDRGVEPTFTRPSCQEPAQPPCGKDVSQDKEPTAAEYTPNLVEALPLARPVMEAEGRQDKIEVGIGEREPLDRAIHEVDMSICPCRLSLLHHSRSGIHPDKLGVGEATIHPT